MNDRSFQLDPLPWTSARHGYDRWAATYDDADPSTLLDGQTFFSLAQPLEGSRILDLGCGTGRFARRCHAGTHVVGLDVSGAMLRRAQAADRHVAWVQGSVDALPFRPSTFDRVVSGLVIDHVVDLPRFFRELADVLIDGGRAVVSAVHPQMQRLTGSTVTFQDKGRNCRMEGVIHELPEVLEAAVYAGLSPLDIHEPAVTAEMIVRKPEWSARLGYPALFIVALEKLG